MANQISSQYIHRDIAVALSLATLSTIRVWLPIWNECYERTYMMKTGVTTAYAVASLLTLCAIAGVILGAGHLARHIQSTKFKTCAQIVLICSLCVPLNALRSVFGADHYALSRYAISTSLGDWRGLLFLCTLIPAGWTFWRFRRPLAQFAYGCLLLIFPLAPLNLAHILWAESTRVTSTSEAVAGPVSPRPHQMQGVSPRVVWIVFDEWDFDLTFEHRPVNLHLPELDRLRNESLFATKASSPSWQTRVSIPALTTGMLLRGVTELGRNDARLAPKDGRDEVRWSKASTVFSEARSLGFNTSVVGSFLPYCRVLGSSLSTCSWSEAPNMVSSTGSSVLAIMANQARSLFETQNFSPFGTSVLSAGYVQMYRDVLSNADATLRGQGDGLVYFHFPIPHPPTIYNAGAGTTEVHSRGARSYLDNLVLVDKTIKHLRETMTADGSWERTTLVLTSDHWYREASLLHGRSDTRVPLMIKLAGDQTPVPFTTAINNVVTREVVLRVLRGEIRTNSQAAAWLMNADGPAIEPTPDNNQQISKNESGAS